MEWLKLSVIFYVVCVVQCRGMSNDELEDFMNFLKKTSQLDQTVRKGVDPEDEFDEVEPVSDHAWEDSGKFEGDLILNDRQRRVIVQDVAEGLSRNGLKDSTKRWPNNEVIYYIQKEHFSSDQVQAIQSGIDDLAQASCIRFRPYKKGDRDAVVIQGTRRGCFSQVGYQSGYQVLNLSGRHPVGRGCFRHGTVVHELLHTLGFYHMQSSPDRDDYIDVVWENIIKRARHNFRKYNSFAVSDFGVGYDYDSVLHYSRRAFSSNGQDTLVPKKGGAEIGQRLGLSDKDTQKLNKMYCDADSNNNEADEVPTSKPVNKKKKPKNKPFDGHGIGYHQGKTVVIKLLPAPETYKLPDVPTFHVFDYFSKAPQALSTSEIEGYRPGKEVIYSQHHPALIKTVESSDIETTNVTKDNPNHNISSYDDKIGVSNLQVNDTPKSTKMTTAENEKSNISSEEQDVDLSNAFDSLTKIIKSHVYPSQIPDLSIYKLKNNYGKLYDYQKYFENKDTLAPKETDDDDTSKSSVEAIRNRYDLAAVRASEGTDYNRGDKTTETYDHEEKHNPNTEQHGDVELTSPDQSKPKSFEVDSSYGTSFPKANEYKEQTDSAIRSYVIPNIEHKNDYSSLHRPKIDSRVKGHHLFGDEVPLSDDWYTKDIHKHNPAVYDTDSYSDSLTNVKSKSDNLQTRNPYHSYDGGNVFDSMPPETNQKYSLFGFEVPLNEEWYKIDYSKINNHGSNKDSASIEDNR